MLKASKIRTAVLVIHGVSAICLGLVFFYLRATMTNPLFEAVAVVIAMLLAAGALILAAITDWFAVFSEGMKNAHRVTFCFLAAVALILAAAFLVGYPVVSMRWLVLVAAVHALAFGVSAVLFAFKAERRPLERRTMFVLGIISILFFGVMAGLVRTLDEVTAIAVLGWYLCFLGAKILFFAWDCDRTAVNRIGSKGQTNTGLSSDAASPVNATKQ